MWGMRGFMSIWVKVGNCTATSFSLRGLSDSGAGDQNKTGNDLVTSLVAGAEEVIGVVPPVRAVSLLRPNGEGTLKGAGKKLLSVPSMCLCVSAMC